MVFVFVLAVAVSVAVPVAVLATAVVVAVAAIVVAIAALSVINSPLGLMAQLLLITWWGNTIFPISFVEDHCSAVAEAVGMCTFVWRPGPGSSTRL